MWLMVFPHCSIGIKIRQRAMSAMDSLFNCVLLLSPNSKEAQKCFCGSANCRGYLGGENRVSIRAAGGKMKKERSRKKDSVSGIHLGVWFFLLVLSLKHSTVEDIT